MKGVVKLYLTKDDNHDTFQNKMQFYSIGFQLYCTSESPGELIKTLFLVSMFFIRYVIAQITYKNIFKTPKFKSDGGRSELLSEKYIYC